MKDCVEVINKIKDTYVNKNDQYNNLLSWVHECIHDSFLDPDLSVRLDYNYLDCSIAYFQEYMVFSVIKEKEILAFTTQATLKKEEKIYDISFCVKPYLLRIYGTNNLGILRSLVKKNQMEFSELIEAVTQDLHGWCTGVVRES